MATKLEPAIKEDNKEYETQNGMIGIDEELFYFLELLLDQHRRRSSFMWDQSFRGRAKVEKSMFSVWASTLDVLNQLDEVPREKDPTRMKRESTKRNFENALELIKKHLPEYKQKRLINRLSENLDYYEREQRTLFAASGFVLGVRACQPQRAQKTDIFRTYHVNLL